MKQKRPNYHSYLLRLWRSSEDDDAPWHAMLINPHTGEHHNFASLAGVMTFLQDIIDDQNMKKDTST